MDCGGANDYTHISVTKKIVITPANPYETLTNIMWIPTMMLNARAVTNFSRHRLQ